VPETVDAVPIMQAADVGILLTDPRYHAEGCANVLLEYMACALPVVCSRGGGNAEVVIGGRTGFIVPPLNPEAVVSALNDLADVNRRVALGSAGRSRVEAEFSVARLVSDTVAVYEELVARS